MAKSKLQKQLEAKQRLIKVQHSLIKYRDSMSPFDPRYTPNLTEIDRITSQIFHIDRAIARSKR